MGESTIVSSEALVNTLELPLYDMEYNYPNHKEVGCSSSLAHSYGEQLQLVDDSMSISQESDYKFFLDFNKNFRDFSENEEESGNTSDRF